MVDPMMDGIGKKWEKLILKQLEALPPEDKQQVLAGLEVLVNELKEKHRKKYQELNRNMPGYVYRAPPMSKEALLVGIITAMYHEKFHESPTFTCYETLSVT